MHVFHKTNEHITGNNSSSFERQSTKNGADIIAK